MRTLAVKVQAMVAHAVRTLRRLPLVLPVEAVATEKRDKATQIRQTTEEEARMERMVEILNEQGRAAGHPGEVTAPSLIRWLLDQKAIEMGLLKPPAAQKKGSKK